MGSVSAADGQVGRRRGQGAGPDEAGVVRSQKQHLGGEKGRWWKVGGKVGMRVCRTFQTCGRSQELGGHHEIGARPCAGPVERHLILLQ